MGRHRKTMIALGLLASAVFMFLAVRRLDFASLQAIFARANLLPWVPLGVLSYVAGHVVRGLRCRLLVRREANLRLVTASNIVVVGYAANNVFPARLGELVRAGMLAERTGIPVAQSLVVTFIERVLDGLAILLLLVIGTMNGEAPGWTGDLVRVALVVFGGACAVMLVAIYSPALVVAGASRVGNRLGPRWHDRLVGLATSITNGGACLRDPKNAAWILLYSAIVWVLETGLFLAILPVFGLTPSFTAAAVAMSVTNLGLLVPSSPGFIGPFHFFCSRALMTHGVDEATALAYAAVVHLAFYVPVTLWGAASMLWYGVEVGATAAMTREARAAGKKLEVGGVVLHELATLSPASSDAPASAFTTALVEAIVVPGGKKAEAPALRDASDFVHGQLGSLQPKLAMLFESGMTFFRFVTRVRYLRGYCDLSLDTRRAWTLSWAESRYGLLRKLFKPVRATALLAYYDHPAMRAAVVVPARQLARKKGAAAPAAGSAPTAGVEAE
ncbi:MAG: flippase-like domain-containing protein [Labilithrix sp.]|nr:flippase-like domain-containing protein [Labilithrix sp.]